MTLLCFSLLNNVAAANMPDAHHSAGIGDFNPNLGRANIRIENGSNVADPPSNLLPGVSGQLDVRGISHMHSWPSRFRRHRKQPIRSKVGNRERIGRRIGLHARCVRDFLIGDHAGDRRKDVHDAVGLVGIVAQEPKMLGRGVERGLGVLFGVLRDFKILQCHGAMFIKVLGSIQLLSREKFVGDGLAIGVEASRNVIAAHAQQDLVFLNGVAKPCAYIATTRPDASVITGTVRAMSGSTTPLAINSDGA